MYTIPNEAAAPFLPQARIAQADINAWSLAQRMTGVLAGGSCAISSDAGTNKIFAFQGFGMVRGKIVAWAGGYVDPGVSDGSNPRIDLVTISNSAVITCTNGTPAANPVCPAIPANSIPLAMFYVPAGSTRAQWTANNLTDKRVTISAATALKLFPFATFLDDFFPDYVAADHASSGLTAVRIPGGYLELLTGAASGNLAYVNRTNALANCTLGTGFFVW